MNIVYLYKNKQHADIYSVLIRVYTILFYLVTVLIEFDWRFLMKRLRIMDLWVVRGLFYTYLGLITGTFSVGREIMSLRLCINNDHRSISFHFKIALLLLQQKIFPLSL